MLRAARGIAVAVEYEDGEWRQPQSLWAGAFLEDVSVTSDQDAWAVGEDRKLEDGAVGVIYRYDGRR